MAGLKYGAGLWVPNNQFRDVNATLHTGTKTGADGKTWNKTSANHWYYTTADVTGSVAAGFLDRDYRSFYTASTTSTVDIANHQLGAMTLHSEFIPFSDSFGSSRYSKYLQVNFAAKIDADVTEGTHFRIAVGQFDSSYAYLDYDLFDLSALDISPTVFTACEAKTTGAMHASTAYVQLHIGLYSPDAGATLAAVDDISLMLDPTTTTAATTYQELSSVYISGAPKMGWTAPGAVDRTTLEGNRFRVNTLKGGPKFQFSAQWHQEDEDAYEILRNAWLISMGQLDSTLPEPLPLVCNFGLGMQPWWGYYDVMGSTFDGTFTTEWTTAGQRYDVGLAFAER